MTTIAAFAGLGLGLPTSPEQAHAFSSTIKADVAHAIDQSYWSPTSSEGSSSGAGSDSDSDSRSVSSTSSSIGSRVRRRGHGHARSPADDFSFLMNNFIAPGAPGGLVAGSPPRSALFSPSSFRFAARGGAHHSPTESVASSSDMSRSDSLFSFKSQSSASSIASPPFKSSDVLVLSPPARLSPQTSRYFNSPALEVETLSMKKEGPTSHPMLRSPASMASLELSFERTTCTWSPSPKIRHQRSAKLSSSPTHLPSSFAPCTSTPKARRAVSMSLAAFLGRALASEQVEKRSEPFDGMKEPRRGLRKMESMNALVLAV